MVGCMTTATNGITEATPLFSSNPSKSIRAKTSKACCGARAHQAYFAFSEMTEAYTLADLRGVATEHAEPSFATRVEGGNSA